MGYKNAFLKIGYLCFNRKLRFKSSDKIFNLKFLAIFRLNFQKNEKFILEMLPIAYSQQKC
ncbi:hypothetical protein BV375_04830 [Nostoc sp. 106C]|nr:hypothetical protein BV375_04830 [Nostoc sp. 106C]